MRSGSIESLLKLLGIWERRDDTIGTFSRGMKQKIAIARALVHDPKYLFLDEPTASLDPEAVSKVREFLGDLRGKGRTIFINTHNLDEAERFCDRIGIINQRLIAVGRPKELADRLWPRIVHIKVANMKGELLANIREMPGVRKVDMVGDELKVDVDEPEARGSEIAKILIDADVKVLHLQEARHSLEDVYMKFMEDGRR